LDKKNNFFFLFFFAFGHAVSVGSELVELAKEVASGSKFVTFKTDEKTWGVTGVNDERLTLHSFGEYKNHTRLEAEAKLTAYLCDFSKPRYAGGGDSYDRHCRCSTGYR
jgi:hypothetical protein